MMSTIMILTSLEGWTATRNGNGMDWLTDTDNRTPANKTDISKPNVNWNLTFGSENSSTSRYDSVFYTPSWLGLLKLICENGMYHAHVKVVVKGEETVRGKSQHAASDRGFAFLVQK